MASNENNERPRFYSAVELVGAGGYDKLRIKQCPYRTPDANEVVVHVKFAGLNFADLMRRYDLYCFCFLFLSILIAE